MPVQCIFGLKELMGHIPFKNTIKAYEGAKVITLDKSAIKSLSKYKSAQGLMDLAEDLND